MKKIGIGASVIVLVVAGALLVTTSRAGYETAAYETVEKEGKFEIRNYEELRVVTTAMSGDDRNGSFGRLFRYISGENEGERKIAMTTPVFMPGTEDGSMEEMQFVVPRDVAQAGAPDPKNEKVDLASVAGGKFAALRFSGRLDKKEAAGKLAELRAELEKRGLKAVGDPVFAGYDPPWTPGPMRRNEVLLRLADS